MMTGETERLDGKRQCTECGTTETYQYKGRQCWHRVKGSLDNWLCKHCYDKLIDTPNRSPRRIYFNGKLFTLLKQLPRTGVCSECGRTVGIDIRQTHLCFLDVKDPSKPLIDAIELCVRCHRRYHPDADAKMTEAFTAREQEMILAA